MSQAGIISTTAGPVPPTVPTSFTTQSGTAVPAANILLVNAYDVIENNVNGIETKGGVAGGDPPGTGATNEVDIYLTNRITGSATTTDAVTQTILYAFNLGTTPATYLFDIKIIAYNITDALSAGYQLYKVVRTTGAVAIDITAQPGIIGEEGAMSGAVAASFFNLNTSGVQVFGIAGKTINWSVLTTYTVVS